MRHLSQTPSTGGLAALRLQVLRSCHSEPTLCCERASGAHGPVPVGNRQLPNGNLQTARAAFKRELSRKAPAARGAAAESSSRRRRPTQYGTCYRIVSVWYGTPHDTVTCYTSAHNGARPRARTHRRAELIERAHHAHVRHARNSNALRPFAEGHRQSLSSSRVFLGPFFSISPTVPSNDCTTIPCSPPCARMPSTDWLIPSSAPAWPEPDRRRSQPCA